jgi:hypothetical protein
MVILLGKASKTTNGLKQGNRLEPDGSGMRNYDPLTYD